MKIIIPKQENNSIIKEIPLELGDYTILAGENNSGKTNLIRAIKDHEDLKAYKKIFVPAEHIQPQNEEAKTSTTATEFYKLLKIILEPIFNKEALKDLIEKFNNSEEKKSFVDDINGILGGFRIEDKEFDIKILEDKFKEDILIKITKAFVRDLYKTDVDYVDFENIGMGTQRLIVAALIQYYVMSKIKDDEKQLIIFEEPEVYLHPKWKEGLFNTLLNLSKEKNILVLITTHDPYFIELGKKQKIYRVYRNPKKKDATDVEDMSNKGFLSFKSDSEINYQIFKIPSKAYFLEIYDHSKRKASCDAMKYKDFDKHMFDTYFQSKGIKQDCKDDNNNDCMAITRLRHDIAHGKDITITPTDLREATKNVISFLNQIK